MSSDEYKIYDYYISDIFNYPLLSEQEEKELLKKIKDGDLEAKRLFINSNLRLVISIAKKYAERDINSFIDLIQDGNIGLLKAIDRFDLSMGTKFSTYASWWIKQSIFRTIILKPNSIKISPKISYEILTYKKMKEQLTFELQRKPSDEEMAKATKLSLKEIETIKLCLNEPTSVNALIGNREDDELLITLESDENIEENYERKALKDEIEKLLETSDLKSKEKRVLYLRFNNCCTLEEIGKELGVTRERIRQIELSALKKIRNNPMLEGFTIYAEKPSEAVKTLNKDVLTNKNFYECFKKTRGY